MDWVENIVKSLKFIEENIENHSLSSTEISKKLYISSSQFQKSFYILTGITVGEYIRNRRLTIATNYLQHTDKSVLDIALDIGYESPEAFTKAFKRLQGISPKEAKNTNIKLKSYPPMQVKVDLIGANPLEFRIVEEDEFFLVGKAIHVDIDKEPYENKIGAFWSKLTEDGTIDYLYSIANKDEIIGVNIGQEDYNNSYIYAIAVMIEEKFLNQYEDILSFKRKVSSRKWVVFECEDVSNNTIENMWKRIYSEWMSISGLEIDSNNQLEIYKYDYKNSREYCEIWIPIKKI